MILYFDNLITNIPLNPGVYTKLDEIRDSCAAYSTKDRYDVTLYTLASYAEFDWDGVVIVYEFGEDMIKRKKEFEKFVKNLWPKAHIFYGRSDNQKKFQERLKFINSLKSDWIFYAGNNDHPFVASNKKIFDQCLKKAQALSKKHKFVSVTYSHFWETYNMSKKGAAYREFMPMRPKILEETKDYFVCLFHEIYGHTIQIFNKNLMNFMVFSEDLGDQTFRKIEEITWHDKLKHKKIDQVTIVPKEVICDHFDGYNHTKKSPFPVPIEIFPPLFIPNGFFENKIKIRFGYEDYKEGWVNINPFKKKFRFQDTKNGTDLKTFIEDLPLFWKAHISKIDVNPELDNRLIEKKRLEILQAMRNPYAPIKEKSFGYRLKYKIVAGNYLPYFLKKSFRNNNVVKKIRRKFFSNLKKDFSE
ncbi:MAG: hypothetical protein WC548_03680 [Candidatus Pacearchaeota archaeon]